MEISASVTCSAAACHAVVRTGAADPRDIDLPARPDGGGCAVNGGELLALALATCYCNDLYREAARLGIVLDGVEVVAAAEFAGVGIGAGNIRYRARIASAVPAAAIEALLQRTDGVAEVHNTLRAGAAVTREDWTHG